MFIPQKSQYALRAVFEMAKKYQPNKRKPLKIVDIATAQAIPVRFLEVLLNTLKKGEFVVSYRGKHGGYQLTRSPSKITVGDVLRFMQGPILPVECLEPEQKEMCTLKDQCVFLPMWEEVATSISKTLDGTTLGDLVERDMIRRKNKPIDFSI